MANHSAAKKSIRRTKRQKAVNSSRTNVIRTFIRKVEDAILAGDSKVAQTALQEAQPCIMHGVTQGVIHLNAASRKISRLSKRIKALKQ